MELWKKINFSLNCENPELFVSSQWQVNKKLPNLKYLLYQWMVTSYFTFSAILSIATAVECNQLKFYFIYITNLNVLLNAAQSLLAAYLVTRFYTRSLNFDNGPNSMTLEFKVFWVLSSSSIVVAVLVSCMYWPIIYNGRDKNLSAILAHAVNAIILVINMFIHAQPPRFSHAVYPASFGFFYMLFTIVYTMSGGMGRNYNSLIYSVLDWKHNIPHSCAFAAAVVVFSVLMHITLTVLIKLKIFLYQKIMTNSSNDDNDACTENLAFEA